MRRSERIVKATVWGLCVCLGGYLAARGYLHLRQSPGTRAQQILGDICMETEREAYLWYMPGIFYEEGTTTPLITKLWTKIENWYPLGMYLKEHQEEEQHPVIEMMSEESGTSQPLDILQQLRTYAGESQKEMIDQILFAFHALEILQMPQEPADPLG